MLRYLRAQEVAFIIVLEICYMLFDRLCISVEVKEHLQAYFFFLWSTQTGRRRSSIGLLMVQRVQVLASN